MLPTFRNWKSSKSAAGIKVFMGSSTGDLLVDDEATLDGIIAKISPPRLVSCRG